MEKWLRKNENQNSDDWENSEDKGPGISDKSAPPSRPLSDPEKREILRLYLEEGLTIDQIREIYPFTSRSSIGRIVQGKVRGSKGVSAFTEPDWEPSVTDTTKGGRLVDIEDVRRYFEPRVGKQFFRLFQEAYAKGQPLQVGGSFQLSGVRDRIAKSLVEGLELKAFLSSMGIDASQLFSNPSKNPGSLGTKELMDYAVLLKMVGKSEDADKYFNLVKDLLEKDIDRLEHQVQNPPKSDIERVIELYTWGEKDPQIRKAIQALLGVEKGPTLGEMIDAVRSLGLDEFLKNLGNFLKRSKEAVSPPPPTPPLEPVKMGEVPTEAEMIRNVSSLTLSGEEKERKPRYTVHEEGEPATGTFEEQERR